LAENPNAIAATNAKSLIVFIVCFVCIIIGVLAIAMPKPNAQTHNLQLNNNEDYKILIFKPLKQAENMINIYPAKA
jgi:hypothetical protein